MLDNASWTAGDNGLLSFLQFNHNIKIEILVTPFPKKSNNIHTSNTTKGTEDQQGENFGLLV